MTYTYHLNKAERGDFNCDVRDPDGKTVWEIIFEAGDSDFTYEGIPVPWRSNYRSPSATDEELEKLRVHLVEWGWMPEAAALVLG
jgi:hypothetical protein